MSVIPVRLSYTIDDLTRVAGLSWSEFAEWADPRLPPPKQGCGNPALSRLAHGWHRPCSAFLEDCVCKEPFRTWQDAATYAFLQAAYFTLPDWTHSVEIIAGQPLAGLSIEETSSILFSKIGDLLLVLNATLYESDAHPKFIEALGLPPSASPEMRLLRLARLALEGPDQMNEAFWRGVQDGLRDDTSLLVAAHAGIQEGRPLTSAEFQKLGELLALGSLQPVVARGAKGEETVSLQLLAVWDYIPADDVGQRVIALLVPIAYQLCRELTERHEWPRHAATCRNPSCGRSFYSGHPDAVACPKPANKRGTSPCKREWDRYRRWLLKTGRNADTEWADPQLQQRYLGH